MATHNKLGDKTLSFNTHSVQQSFVNQTEQKGRFSFLQGWTVLFILFFILLTVGILSGEWIGGLFAVSENEDTPLSYETYIDPPQQEKP